jgi:phage terminase Nu1 subunit (DNA packaging protein)
MQCSINQLSELTGRDRRTIKRRIEALPTDDQGRYDSTQALPLLYGSKGELDPSQERAKLDQARRELAELEFSKRRGALIEEGTVFRVVESAATACREHLLTIPGRMADSLAAEANARSIEATLNQEIRSALERITDVSRYDFGKQADSLA